MLDKCVLVVDGDELIRWALKRKLSAHRMSVRAFSDSATARKHLADGPCDLVLVDVDPREGSRLRLIEEIRALHPSATIIAMGYDPTPEHRRHAFTLGCAQFVDKPFDLREILNLALNAVGRSPRRRRFPRYCCRLPLRLSVLSPSLEEAGLDLDNLGGTTVDIAQEGLRIRTAYPLRPGQLVRVHLPSEASPLEGAMTVVWTADDPEGVVAGCCCHNRLSSPARTS